MKLEINDLTRMHELSDEALERVVRATPYKQPHGVSVSRGVNGSLRISSLTRHGVPKKLLLECDSDGVWYGSTPVKMLTQIAKEFVLLDAGWTHRYPHVGQRFILEGYGEVTAVEINWGISYTVLCLAIGSELYWFSFKTLEGKLKEVFP